MVRAIVLVLLAGVAASARSGEPPPVNAGTPGRELFAPPVRESFTFVLFGDRTTGRAAGLPVLDRAIDVANRLDPDFVVNVGDMVQGYSTAGPWLAQMKEYREHLERLRPPWFPVVGNHDVLGGRRNPKGNAPLYQEHFGPLYYSFDYRWGHFVCLYSDESISPASPTKGQMMSDDQFAWLEKDLATTKAKQVFVFLHHPRWLYRNTNWSRVHELFKKDGRIRAVVAGHLHQYRDDGVRDGIHYYVLATTGGRQGAFPDTAGMHHIQLVRVRPEGFSISVLPLGGVVGSDAVLGSELNTLHALKAGGWVAARGPIEVPFSGETEVEIRTAIRNPTKRACGYEIAWTGPDGWTFTPATVAGSLGAGETLEETVTIRGPGFSGVLPDLRLSGTLSFPLSSGLVQPVLHAVRANVRLRDVPRSRRSTRPKNRVLLLDGKSAVRVPFPDDPGPFTLECWARGKPPEGRRALIARNDRSSLGLYWCYDKERLPYAAIGLRKVPGGRAAGYVYVRAAKAWEFERWTHVALTWDGKLARLFVDGRLAEEREAAAPRSTNRHPLFVGADTDERGRATSPFLGALDEVRLSSVSRYSRAFRPRSTFSADRETTLLLHFDADDEKLFADDSGRGNHGWPVGRPRIEDEKR